MAARNYDRADFARVFASGLRETEAILADLVGMDRLNEFDLSAVKAVLDEALGWNPHAQYLMGELCMRGGVCLTGGDVVYARGDGRTWRQAGLARGAMDGTLNR